MRHFVIVALSSPLIDVCHSKKWAKVNHGATHSASDCKYVDVSFNI